MNTMAKPSVKLLASTMIGTNMTDTKQIEMRIHQVKNDLSTIKSKAETLEEQMREFFSITDDIKIQLAELRSKL